MKKRLVGFLVALSAMAMLTGCTDDSSKDISKLNIDKYLLSIGDYKNLEVEAQLHEVTEDDVNLTIQYMLASAPINEPVTGRALQVGDVSNIDFVGKIDGVAFDGGTGSNQELEIGSGQFIPGFEDAIVGMEIGEVRDIDVTFPEEYPVPDLAGKPAVFTVTLNSISEKVTPELTEEYVQGLGLEGVTTIDQFKASVKEQLMQSAEDSYNTTLEAGAMNALLDVCEFSDEVPSERYSYYYDSMVSEDTQQAEAIGTDLEKYVKAMYGFETVDEYYKNVEDYAIRAVHLDLATAKVLEAEKNKVTSKDVEECLKNDFADFGFASADEFKKNVNTEDLKSYLINKRAAEIVKSNASVVAPKKAEE